MTVDIDLKQVQRKVYMSYFQDGLWDILLGLFLLAWGIMITQDFVAVLGGIWVAGFFTVLGLKKLITYPRTGFIKIAQAQKQQLKMVILGVVLLVMGLVNAFLFYPSVRPDWLSEYFMFMFGGMMAVVIAILGFWWKVNRWYAYAGLLLACFAVYQWLDVSLGLAFFIPGGVIAIYGIQLLIRFVHRYPKQAEEDVDVGR